MKQHISYLMGGDHSAESELSDSFENFVFSDIEENIIFKKKSIDGHFDNVMSSLGNSYNGVNKYVYGNTLFAIKTVVSCKTTNKRRTSRCKDAIAFLHQDIRLSPSMIQRILLLFGVKLQTSNILRDSSQVFADTIPPSWLQKILQRGGI